MLNRAVALLRAKKDRIFIVQILSHSQPLPKAIAWVVFAYFIVEMGADCNCGILADSRIWTRFYNGAVKWRSTKKPRVSLSINQQSVLMVAMSEEQQLLGFARVNTADLPLSVAIKRAFRELGVGQTRLSMCIGAADSLMGELKLPVAMTVQSIYQHLDCWLSANYCLNEQGYISFETLTRDDQWRYIRWVLTRKQQVMMVCRQLRATGLSVARVDVDLLAYVRLWRSLVVQGFGLLVVIDAASIMFAMLKHHRLVWQRRVPIVAGKTNEAIVFGYQLATTLQPQTMSMWLASTNIKKLNLNLSEIAAQCCTSVAWLDASAHFVALQQGVLPAEFSLGLGLVLDESHEY